jgi:hypothetical protein
MSATKTPLYAQLDAKNLLNVVGFRLAPQAVDHDDALDPSRQTGVQYLRHTKNSLRMTESNLGRTRSRLLLRKLVLRSRVERPVTRQRSIVQRVLRGVQEIPDSLVVVLCSPQIECTDNPFAIDVFQKRHVMAD